MANHYTQSLDKLSACLQMDRKPVGVRFLFTKEEYDACPLPAAKARMAYCVMVKNASNGVRRKADLSLFACGGATRALGLESPSPSFLTGEEYLDFGLYQDLATAKDAARHITLCNHKLHGVMIQPLSDFTEDCPPHVVLLITNAYNAMRVVQAYTYKFGTYNHFKMAGNQALCAECTAYPFEFNAINVSMLCAGTRHLAGWSDTELAIGLPYARFLAVCDGLYQSANGAEGDGRKAVIREALAQRQLPDPGLKDGEAYFLRH